MYLQYAGTYQSRKKNKKTTTTATRTFYRHSQASPRCSWRPMQRTTPRLANKSLAVAIVAAAAALWMLALALGVRSARCYNNGTIRAFPPKSLQVSKINSHSVYDHWCSRYNRNQNAVDNKIKMFF